MLSLNTFPQYNIQNSYSNYFTGSDISDILSKGDKALNENKFEEALKAYEEANKKNPDDDRVYKKLGKAYYNLKDYKNAQKAFTTFLNTNPNDVDCLIELGEAQRADGLYKKATESFEKAAKLDNSNDLAKRNILETKNNILSIYSPLKAQQEKQEYAAKNLQQALDITVKYMSNEYMKDLNDITITFGETAQMGGTSNIAQYENYKKAITVSDKYIYASPQVIAAYLTHEAVHAKDKDPYTSIREEQDAYTVATKFWIQHSNGIKDPEMDYAADLYKQSPEKLNNRVEEIYKLRDPSINQTSPNHPPEKLFHFNKTSKKAASMPIKEYNIIA